jgi:hypothetical protein
VWETLREAGYESGEFVGPVQHGPVDKRHSTPSTSYTRLTDETFVIPKTILPSGGDLQIAVSFRASKSGKNHTVGVQDVSQFGSGNFLVEHTTNGSTDTTSGFVSIDRSALSSPSRILTQVKSPSGEAITFDAIITVIAVKV